MTLAQHSRRRSWRVRTSAGNCLVVRRSDLEPGEIPDSSSFSRFEIAAWARDPFLWPVLLEMYQAAFGHHVAASDAFWLEDKLEEAFRAGSLVIIPEVNPEHARIISAQRRRLRTTRGFVAVKPNCSLQTYVPALHPLLDLGPQRVAVATYQAISGAGRTFESWPEMVDNVIPFIQGEEEKSEQEPLKLWGRVEGDRIVPARTPVFSSQCLRVPVTDGHMAAVFIGLERKAPRDEIIARWREFSGRPQELGLPSAPRPFLTYYEDEMRPQTRLDRDLGNGMGIAIGRLRPDALFDHRFVTLSHNTVRGAAGGAILTAELLVADGYIEAK